MKSRNDSIRHHGQAGIISRVSRDRLVSGHSRLVASFEQVRPWPPSTLPFAADNTNLPDRSFCSRQRQENGLFSHYAYYVANAQPLPGYPRGGKPVIIITRPGIAILCFIFGNQSPGIVVTRTWPRLSLQSSNLNNEILMIPFREPPKTLERTPGGPIAKVTDESLRRRVKIVNKI